MVLTPVNRVLDDLNARLRELVNGDSPRVVDRKGREWRLHDRVIMTENCYDIDVMNGEEGEVVDYHEDWIEVKFPQRQAPHPLRGSPVATG